MQNLRIHGTQGYRSASSPPVDEKKSSAPAWSRSTSAAAPNQRSYEPGSLSHVRKDVQSKTAETKEPASPSVDGVSFKKIGWWVGAATVALPAYGLGAIWAHGTAKKAGYGEDVQAFFTPGGAMPAAAFGAWAGGCFGEKVGDWVDSGLGTGNYATIPLPTERRRHSA